MLTFNRPMVSKGSRINGMGSSSKIPDFCQNDLFWAIFGPKKECYHFENGIFQKYSPSHSLSHFPYRGIYQSLLNVKSQHFL